MTDKDTTSSTTPEGAASALDAGLAGIGDSK